MNPIILSATMDYTKPIEGFAEKLKFGGLMVLIGMAAVFAVLFIIYLSLVLFKFAFAGKGKKISKSDTPAPIPYQPANTTNNDEIIAVIAAAIAIAEADNPGKQFKVVSFRRI